ncbi:LysR substrate-binding domain-containing protein [Methylibium sp.]|uniref:LysR substrate-binding domain-containing protein n=1 Tax=Methylibium sp. TaxID=2067992 RepID=UPI003D12B989
MKHAAGAGLGLACLSSWVVDDLIRTGRLVCLATTLPEMRRQCYLVVHRQKHGAPALRNFVAQAMACRPMETHEAS